MCSMPLTSRESHESSRICVSEIRDDSCDSWHMHVSPLYLKQRPGIDLY